MPITEIFTKEDQAELKKMKKQEKEGKVIDWGSYLTKRSLRGQERWKNYQKKPKPLKQAEKAANETKKKQKKRRKKSATDNRERPRGSCLGYQ